MILTTEKSAKAVKEFEELMANDIEVMLEDSTSITEEEKLLFYSISRMYESYDVFRHYIQGVFMLFLEAGKNNELEGLLTAQMMISEIFKGGD